MADRISVIVPVYNVATDLPRCLDSILAQTYPDIEIVAVNDGSPDNSGEILDQYAEKHSHIRVIHKKNGGVTSARLKGIQEATGEWIGFVDGDDMIEPDMYERLLKNAKEYDAQISHCGYQMCFADGRVHYFYNTGLLAKQDKITALKELLSGAMIEPGLCNKLFHKTLFHDEVVDTSIKINEDLLMNFYLFSAAEQTVFEDWCPYHYIVREGSASRTRLSKYKIYDPIRVKEEILQDVDSVLIPAAQSAYLTTCISVYNSIILSRDKGFEEDRCQVREWIRNHAGWRNLLSKKQQLLAVLIHYVPILYKPLYRFYATYFLKNPYI